MRLIDADVMIDILRKSNESHATNSREEVLLERNVRLVEEQAKYHPVIIEQRPHGELKETTHAVVCSNCGHNIDPRLFGAYMRYCCVCGSDNWKEGEAE